MEVYEALDLLTKAEVLAKANAFPHREQRYQEVAKKRKWGKVIQPRRSADSVQALKRELEDAKAIQAAMQTKAPALIDLDIITKAFETWREAMVGKVAAKTWDVAGDMEINTKLRSVAIPPRPALPPIAGHVDVLMAELEAIGKDIERRKDAKKKQG